MSRAMIVVAAGSSSRFGEDKMMADIQGKPLVAHTVERVRGVVDECVLVCRADQQRQLASLLPQVTVVIGGATRTDSEMAGLAVLGERDLIGVHDGARPLVSARLIEALFQSAEENGGAVPVLEPSALVIDRRTHQPVHDVVTVQTPQVFRGPPLLAAFARAARTGFSGDDTLAVMHRFGDLEVVAVPGEPDNLKVTYPEDLDRVSQVLGANAHTEPR